jgi:hypothetical protein
MSRKNRKNTGVNQCSNKQMGTTTNYDKLKEKESSLTHAVPFCLHLAKREQLNFIHKIRD